MVRLLSLCLSSQCLSAPAVTSRQDLCRQRGRGRGRGGGRGRRDGPVVLSHDALRRSHCAAVSRQRSAGHTAPDSDDDGSHPAPPGAVLQPGLLSRYDFRAFKSTYTPHTDTHSAPPVFLCRGTFLLTAVTFDNLIFVASHPYHPGVLIVYSSAFCRLLKICSV